MDPPQDGIECGGGVAVDKPPPNLGGYAFLAGCGRIFPNSQKEYAMITAQNNMFSGGGANIVAS